MKKESNSKGTHELLSLRCFVPLPTHPHTPVTFCVSINYKELDLLEVKYLKLIFLLPNMKKNEEKQKKNMYKQPKLQ